MEKPVERTSRRRRRLLKPARRQAFRSASCFSIGRPAAADLRRTAGSLGELLAVEINVPWWRPQSYYDAPSRGSYARDGGGVLISQAIHTLDLAISLAGPVAEVSAMMSTTGFHEMESEDFVTAGLRFENGAVGQLFASTASFPGRGETITFHHRAGSAHLDAGTVRIERQDGTSDIIGTLASSGAGPIPWPSRQTGTVSSSRILPRPSATAVRPWCPAATRSRSSPDRGSRGVRARRRPVAPGDV